MFSLLQLLKFLDQLFSKKSFPQGKGAEEVSHFWLNQPSEPGKELISSTATWLNKSSLV